ncbi:MAG: PKD domain-containing protein [Bacteroidota bacterium]
MKKSILFLLLPLLPAFVHAQITAEFSYDSVTCGNEITVTDISSGETVISRSWYQDDSLLTGDGPEEYTFSIGTINIADTVTVSLVVEGTTGTDSVAHQVICHEEPEADAGNDDVVCGLQYDLEAYYNLPQTQGYDPYGFWYEHPDNNGSVNFANDSAATTVNVSEHGEYLFIWREFNALMSSCNDRDTVLIEFKANPVIYAGDDFDVCGKQTNLNAYTNGFDGSWLPEPGADFEDINDPGTGVEYNSGYGPVEFIWQGNNGECISQDTVTVTFWQQPNAELAMDPEDTAVCGKICNIRAENPGSGVNGHWIANPSYGVTFYQQFYSDTMEVSEYGYYDIRWVESNHPDNEPPEFCVDTTDPWTIHFIEIPVPYAGSDTIYCGLEGELQAELSLQTSNGEWSDQSGSITFDTITDPNAMVIGNVYTEGNPNHEFFELVWTENNYQCTNHDTVEVRFARIPETEITIIPPNCFGDPASIKANEDFHPEYNWDLHGGIVDSIWPPISDTTGEYRMLVHWPITSEDDTVHDISLQVQNRYGCWSDINDTVVYEPSIPDYELEITPDSCLLGNGSVVFIPDSSSIAFHWIDTAGLNIDDPYDTVQTNIPAGTYDVEMVYEGQNESSWWPSPYDLCRDTFDVTLGNLGFSDADFTVSDSVVYMADPVVYFSYEGAVTDSVFWYFGDGNTSVEHNPSHTYPEPGIYTVTLYAYNSNDCGDMLSKNIEVIQNSSIDTKHLEGIVIYPNPTGGKITIKSEHASIKQVQIFDITGNKTKDVFFGSNQFSVDLTLQGAKGIFIIKLITESGTYFRRVVVQ